MDIHIHQILEYVTIIHLSVQILNIVKEWDCLKDLL
jgi:hypothetical protein